MTKRYMLKFGKEVEDPVLAECILETKALIRIIKAEADGKAVVEFPAKKEKEVLAFLHERGVDAYELKKKVKLDIDLCVDCGSCISVCPTNALSFDKNKKLVFDEEKCVLCRKCIDACPRKALSLVDF